MPAVKALDFNEEIREKLLLMSTIAGIVIAQAGTSLPHACGYMPTYERGIPHGRANAIFTTLFLTFLALTALKASMTSLSLCWSQERSLRRLMLRDIQTCLCQLPESLRFIRIRLHAGRFMKCIKRAC